jgi:hypothetical protein
MRARTGAVIGWVLVGGYAAAMLAVALTTSDGPLRPGDRPDPGAAEAFVDAWDRSRTATFLRTGTFERRSEATGAEIASEDVLVQRPPRRLHRQLGGVSGRDDDRLLVCPAPVGDGPPPECRLGTPGGPTYAEDVEAEVEGLRSLLEGPDPVYGVGRGDDGCFALVQRRSEPRAPFGLEARFCFDAATGAPIDSEVRYVGGIVEVVAVTDLVGEVRSEDLVP